ncbi:ECF transporter S component [Metabacillus fastidiosus]|uniref:Riboflavin transporter n=1 Tax=Metabacillus fastidiosus TaxID=1458 RepID=A0ABU6NUD0_9BACI|nr:ECF transporter S component [Metabacillus fastidiosus]MEC2075714.1 ECF transporter S component [Metabacillus fastidiosus]MED4400746.1 ECF transporter S component [Metabacillus fastidiosus]MED4453678.1 ECF transporter S component [Metabacillus fastidiosus]MED4462917.1 ECF transporter S component [Metabacillus fastidiosus]MED4532230.1 ECF transporter S component [Metabacillus fastidiosus]
MNVQGSRVKKQVTVGMLSSIAYLLIMVDFPLPVLPNFLLIDFSEIPALIAAIVFGPGAGIMVEAIKNILHYLIQGSATGVPVGEISNFIAGVLFIVPSAYMFRRFKSMKGLTAGLVLGTVLMAVVMSILNYFVIMPAYVLFLNIPEMSAEALKAFVVKGILPFNIIKGLIITALLLAVMSKIKTWILTQMKTNYREV